MSLKKKTKQSIDWLVISATRNEKLLPKPWQHYRSLRFNSATTPHHQYCWGGNTSILARTRRGKSKGKREKKKARQEELEANIDTKRGYKRRRERERERKENYIYLQRPSGRSQHAPEGMHKSNYSIRSTLFSLRCFYFVCINVVLSFSISCLWANAWWYTDINRLYGYSSFSWSGFWESCYSTKGAGCRFSRNG